MASIPKFDCKDGCSACCGLVPFSEAEKMSAMIQNPLLQWEKFDETHWVSTQALATFSCPMLIDNKCSIYKNRPKVCQLFGAVDDPRMTCPKGCGPVRKLTESQSRRILAAA